MFPTNVTLTKQIFGILASQIEIEGIFAIIRNLDKLIFVNKNWPYDPRVGCFNFFDFAYVCEAQLDLIKDLDVEFTNEVQREEFLEV